MGLLCDGKIFFRVDFRFRRLPLLCLNETRNLNEKWILGFIDKRDIHDVQRMLSVQRSLSPIKPRIHFSEAFATNFYFSLLFFSRHRVRDLE